MKKVLDSSGQTINGLLRDDSGALVVDDRKELAKYKNQLAREQELKDLREQVESLIRALELGVPNVQAYMREG